MSVAVEFNQSTDSSSEHRSVLGPGGNRVRVSESEKKKKEKMAMKKNTTQQTRKVISSRLPEHVTRSNSSFNSSCSSDSVSSASSLKVKSLNRRIKQNVKVVEPERGAEGLSQFPDRPILVRRCDWITPNSDPLYASFHDEEWGVPIHDDNKLFELLVLSIALAELSWPAILHQRDLFRKLFDNFDIASVSKFTEKKILTLKAQGNLLLSEAKFRAVVDNAKQILKVQQELESFDNYMWSFVNFKTIKNGYRYARQVPVKTPKADVISKDLMRRGFRCVGPTVVYSFMQVAGIVNDHLISCFRYQECVSNEKMDTEGKCEEREVAKSLEKICLSPV